MCNVLWNDVIYFCILTYTNMFKYAYAVDCSKKNDAKVIGLEKCYKILSLLVIIMVLLFIFTFLLTNI